MKANGMSVQHVIKLLLTANNDLQSIERVCQDLKREEADVTAKNLNAARTFQMLSDDISEQSRLLEEYRSSCREVRRELDKLRLQKIELESFVRQFQNNNESFQRIRICPANS
jgi:septal ring factor EnvC (AmiA/AmiB activator)